MSTIAPPSGKRLYEIHITLEPDFERLEELEAVAIVYEFRLAKLLMRKLVDGEAIEVRAEDDMFITGRTETWRKAVEHTEATVRALIRNGFTVRRYKIEHILMDSNHGDKLRLLTPKTIEVPCGPTDDDVRS